jgi:4-amino-4-deoxy-L-arabinose transferase-like glycosyltransferase
MSGPTHTSRLPRTTVAILLALIAGAIALGRLHTYHEPLDRDVATYAVIAGEMLHGRALYTDLWDHKPPAVYAVFAAAQAVVSEPTRAIFLLGLLCAWTTALALFAAGSWGAGPQAGLWTAAFWALLSADLPLQASQPNTEALINACLAIAFAALLRVGPRPFEGWVWAAGLFLGTAILLKPVVAPVALAWSVVHVLAPPAQTPRARAAVQAAVVLGLCVLGVAAVAGYFAATGRWTDLWSTLVVHNRSYAGPLLPNLREGLRPARLFPPVLRDVLPLLAAVLPALAFALVTRWSRRGALLVAWMATVPLAIAAPGRFFPHYYQLWLPPLCLAAGWSLAALGQRTRLPSAVTAAGGAAVALAIAFRIAPAYALAAADWSDTKYGDVFLRSRDIAREAGAMIGPGETLFQWGNQPEIYLYARRSPPTGVLWAQHMQTGPLRNQLRSRALTQLSVADPQLVVLSHDEPRPTGALGAWFKERYEPHPTRVRQQKGFSFWVRRGGTLQRRLLAERTE